VPNNGNTGDSATATFTGFGPNTSVQFTFRSDPVSLGTVVANSQGVAVLTFTVPTSADVGLHQVEAAGVAANGQALVLNASYTVNGVLGATVTQPDGTSSSPEGTSTEGANLATTGSNATLPLVRAGLVAIAIGGLVVMGVRKRRGMAVD
jgi:hypothetical protein